MMARILTQHGFADDVYQQHEGDFTPDLGRVLLPLAAYLANRETLAGRNDVGVWLCADEEIEALETFINDIPVIALHFPAFTDGRSLSNAVIARKHYGYAGQIRAIGDVRLDILEQLHRCGFDAYDLAEDQDVEHAAEHLKVFSHDYQTTLTTPGVIARRSAGDLTAE